MRASFLFVLLVACSNDTPGDEPDASTMDGTKADTSTDASIDTGHDTSISESGAEASDDAMMDDGSMDSGIDTGLLDADNDGSICPPCPMNFKCCTIMKSMNYGKCTNTACLACCM